MFSLTFFNKLLYYQMSCVWISSGLVRCAPMFADAPLRMDYFYHYYYCYYCYYYHYSSFYCYYYRFQVSILPCGLTLGATASHAPTTPQGKSWYQTPDWVDRAKTCDFKSGSYSSEQGGEMLPSCSRISQKHLN